MKTVTVPEHWKVGSKCTSLLPPKSLEAISEITEQSAVGVAETIIKEGITILLKAV